MEQEDIIYSRAKENLRKHWRTAGYCKNEKVIYEAAIALYLVWQEYREDTRIFSVTQSIYEEERAKMNKLKKKIRRNEPYEKEAAEACKDALAYMELIVRPRIRMNSLV